MHLVRLMRPVHWVKNVFVLAALVFGRQLLGPTQEAAAALGRALGAFVCFCLAASAVYIVNDIFDREVDRTHPTKRNRPIAAGQVTTSTAAMLSAACGGVALVGAYLLTPGLAAVIAAYILLMGLYSLSLKQVMILDCIVISIGFVLRAVAGAVAVRVFISPWLVICTFSLCLFLAFSKRRGEIAQLQENSDAFRRTLADYTPELLAHMLDVTSVLAVVCFLLYAMDGNTQKLFKTDAFIYTTPIVLYCVFRFSALVQKGIYADPVELILKDRAFQVGVVLWLVCCVAVIYGRAWFCDAGGFLPV